MDNRGNASVQVGLFSLLAVVVFVGFLFWVSGGQSQALFSFSEDRRTVIVRFTDITGVAPEAPVTVAGQRVGEVTNRQLDGKTSVVTMKIDRDVQLYENATFSVEAIGLFGGARIALDPGGAIGDDSQVALAEPQRARVDGQEQDVLIFGLGNSASAAGLGELTEQGTQTVRIVNTILSDFRGSQAVLQADLERMMKRTANILDTVDQSLEAETLRGITEQMELLITQSNEMIAENRAAILALVEQSGGTLETIEDQVRLRGDETGELLRTLNVAVSDSVAPLVAQLRALTLTLERVLQDNEQSLHDTMVNIRDATANLERFTARIQADPSLIIFGGSEEDAPDAGPSASTRRERQLRDDGRSPIYDKRD